MGMKNLDTITRRLASRRSRARHSRRRDPGRHHRPSTVSWCHDAAPTSPSNPSTRGLRRPLDRRDRRRRRPLRTNSRGSPRSAEAPPRMIVALDRQRLPRARRPPQPPHRRRRPRPNATGVCRPRRLVETQRPHRAPPPSTAHPPGRIGRFVRAMLALGQRDFVFVPFFVSAARRDRLRVALDDLENPATRTARHAVRIHLRTDGLAARGAIPGHRCRTHPRNH